MAPNCASVSVLPHYEVQDRGQCHGHVRGWGMWFGVWVGLVVRTPGYYGMHNLWFCATLNESQHNETIAIGFGSTVSRYLSMFSIFCTLRVVVDCGSFGVPHTNPGCAFCVTCVMPSITMMRLCPSTQVTPRGLSCIWHMPRLSHLPSNTAYDVMIT